MRFGPPFSLLLFHSRSGARIALRRLSVPLAVIGGLGQFLDEALWPRVAHLAFGPRQNFASWSFLLLILILAAKDAAPKLRGDTGWLRHLPASRAHHRIARTLGLAFAISPLVAALAGLAALERRGLPLLGSLATLLACTLAASALFGMVDGPRRTLGASPNRRERSAALGFGLDLESRITLRAIGPLGILQALAPAVPIFSIAGFFAANNELAPVYEIRGALLAASVAMTVALSILAERLAARRPIWGWARSLPRAASSRVRADALGFALVALPIALAAAVFAAIASVAGVAAGSTNRGLLAEAAGAALALVPPLSACAAAAIRGNPEARIGPSGEIFWMGFLSALLTTLVPPLSLGFLAATPWLLNLAARRERAARPSRFGALRHLSDGDPFSLGSSR